MPDQPATLGEIIRRQRELTELSMRQFAGMVGISNPYMSQIERGLRDPSEKVLEEIARNLDVSADALYEQAGMSDAPEDDETGGVRAAIREDPRLNPRQRRALLEVYDAFAGPPLRRRRRGAGAEPDESLVHLEHDLALAWRQRGVGGDRGRHRRGRGVLLGLEAGFLVERVGARLQRARRSPRRRAPTARAARARSGTGTGWRSRPCWRTGASRAG